MEWLDQKQLNRDGAVKGQDERAFAIVALQQDRRTKEEGNDNPCSAASTGTLYANEAYLKARYG
jgi:hypothetical protein